LYSVGDYSLIIGYMQHARVSFCTRDCVFHSVVQCASSLSSNITENNISLLKPQSCLHLYCSRHAFIWGF